MGEIKHKPFALNCQSIGLAPAECQSANEDQSVITFIDRNQQY